MTRIICNNESSSSSSGIVLTPNKLSCLDHENNIKSILEEHRWVIFILSVTMASLTNH